MTWAAFTRSVKIAAVPVLPAGPFEAQGLWRIRFGKPPARLEYLADICDFARSADGDLASPTADNEIA
jgi:hypothetical protein